MEDKKTIRQQMKARLQQLTDEQKQAYDKEIARNLYALPLWQNATTIGITISRGIEVNTKPIIEKAWQAGKAVAVPKCDPVTKTMRFREICSFSQLESVYFDLWEPIAAVTREVAADDIDVMIVPGICFSRNGYRIGYGGGYYDRYLQHFSQTTISLAYTFQVIDDIPSEPHDIPVQQIITNDEVIVCDE
ncbi:5-formyltetrahydrofolate cyclo-ligase [Thermaerobacillus caldiproteolyticus]|uniref:5-formyltetrahydrofolate cyclo-ligase n=1 Tax=Thermaerobacillus caldiproteolyticus TaxID=247480 RepID=A0A7V9Z3S0_9BACL|nr:5-formyltetrahydrofolate cyclo-ligase [Anoxybacillus caldiproteolyticus]MBA2873481.1 5-formyltetrahydrofolate cyclo-ligase [Anoxybacillus caldiproteolyticus]QPA30076.1 5-formyltetrahydrofolate cyclo-ligase [Anoxybacillus caldiproteolyticus]